MFSTKQNNDEQAAAQLLWQLKAIATKEVEKVSLPYSCVDSFYTNPSEGRGRTVSLDSGDLGMKAVSPIFPYVPQSYMETGKSSFLLDTPEKPIEQLDHHDWGPAAPKRIAHSPLIGTEEGTKHGKRKRESHVGLTTKSGIIRCTLRKKFSWKQYPELEDYLLRNQEEYFEYSSRNYTAEQRKYNNALTRGLLDLASSEGYVFEEFTFSMVRDRIRCYYKSHSQSAKKKRRR